MTNIRRKKMREKKSIKHFRELDVYKRAFDCAMRIYRMCESLPRAERFCLVDPMVRSSRSICSNISEAWRKRKYIAYFKNKLTDAMSEASETQTWCDFCLACGYIDNNAFQKLDSDYETIIAQLNTMIMKAESFCY